LASCYDGFAQVVGEFRTADEVVMWWKIVACFHAILYLSAVFAAAHHKSAFGLITLALLFPALASLFLRAFDKCFLPKVFWISYSILFAAVLALLLALFAKMSPDILTFVIPVATFAIFLSFVLRCLWWLTQQRA
jgi:hypothetical protein